ncbi:MAG: TonB-dependent receptor [Bacteroidetes bacterium]|nr:TonB-dependent receptor [Bacteroidota bacterium]
MQRIVLIGVALFLVLPRIYAQHYTGDLVGTIIDRKTSEPLPYATVHLVENPFFGTLTDSTGTFIIRTIPVGTYSLKASLVGYEPQIVTNVVISTGRSTKLTVRLQERPVEHGEVTVEASYYSKSTALSPISINSYDRAEVKRQPGSAQDIQRVVQNLPGIASSSDNINELIVRGGAPYENLTIVDHMEIPSINHYSNQENSAGPINMINIDLVDDVQFSSGGFSAQYGDKISSVMDITIREGDRQKAFASNTGFNFAGIGTLTEGSINDGRGSWILSLRRSYLDLFDKLFGISKISLTAIPVYWDAQTKVTYDLSSQWKLSLNALYGSSTIFIKGKPNERNLQRAHVIDSTSVFDIDFKNNQYVLGLNIKHLFEKNGFAVLTLYTYGTRYNTDVAELFVRREYDTRGILRNYDHINRRIVYNNNTDEAVYAIKAELFYKVHPRHELTLGGQLQTTNHWFNSVTFNGDLLEYDLDGNGTYDYQQQRPDASLRTALGAGDVWKYAAFLSDRIILTPQLSTTVGLRYDHFSYSRATTLSPRFALAYELIPTTTILSFALGEYSQTQPLPYYSDRRNIGYNRRLPHIKARHYVAGIQQYFDDGIKVSVEAYYKYYWNIAVVEQFIYSSDPTFWSDRVLPVGKKRSYGIELFIQKKQVTNYYGTITFSLSKTTEKDPRIPQLVPSYTSTYDYPIIINVVGGKVVKGMRSWLDHQPWFLKYPSYIFPFSDEMEVGLRYRYQSGNPYTPKYFTTSQRFWEGGIQWSRGMWIDSQNINSSRYPAYSRLDIQWISRYYMKGWNINVYLSIMNVLNRKNVFYHEYRSDGTTETVYQFEFFPVGGIEVEF